MSAPMKSFARRWIAALGFVVAVAAADAASYEYKLFQYPTDSMEKSVETFASKNPGWEIVTIAPLSFQDRGSVSILVLAKRETGPAPHVIAATNVVVPPEAPSHAMVVDAPAWAKSSGYADNAAAALDKKYSPPTGKGIAHASAIVDVVVDPSGTVKFATARNGKVSKELVDAAIAAVNALGTLGAPPAGANLTQLAERSFTFSFRP